MSGALALLALVAAGAGAPSAGVACAQARSPVEKAVCGSPPLRAADAALATAYVALRRQAPPAVAASLQAAQRAWIAARDRRCAKAETACLTSAYAQRKEELSALAASAEASGGRLQDATVVIVRGRWKAAKIFDPEAQGEAPPDPTLSKTLLFGDLPQLGETVETRPGEICLKDRCRTVGWRAARLDEETERLASALKRPGGSPMYVGGDGGRLSIRLIPDGPRLLAAVALCAPHSDDCRNGFEVWEPSGADAQVQVVRPPRP